LPTPAVCDTILNLQIISADHNSKERHLSHEGKQIFNLNIVIATLVKGQAPKLKDFMETTTKGLRDTRFGIFPNYVLGFV
jgi:hypothetical protein